MNTGHAKNPPGKRRNVTDNRDGTITIQTEEIVDLAPLDARALDLEAEINRHWTSAELMELGRIEAERQRTILQAELEDIRRTLESLRE